MITETEKQQIRFLLQDPKWGAIQHLADQLCDKVQYESKRGSNEFETLAKVFGDEGQVQGIKRLFQELFKQAT